MKAALVSYDFATKEFSIDPFEGVDCLESAMTLYWNTNEDFPDRLWSIIMDEEARLADAKRNDPRVLDEIIRPAKQKDDQDIFKNIDLG